MPPLECDPCRSGEETGTRSLFQEHKKELAAALSGLFCVLAVLGLVFGVDSGGLSSARNWAKQDWKQSICSVEDSGIAYRGSCQMDVTLMMTDFSDFAECMGPRHMLGEAKEVRKDWEATGPGRCAARGNEAYAAAQGDAPPTGRRLGKYWHERIVCHNSYLPWAVLRVHNSTGVGSLTRSGVARCAYEFGAVRPSITGDWDAALALLGKLKQARAGGSGVLCWTLATDDCIVALRDQGVLTEKEQGERNLIRAHTLVCGALALLLGACVACWQWQEGGLCEDPTTLHVALPTEEPEPLGGRVQQLAAAAASQLEETTPPASGSSTLRLSGADRSHRTVEVVLPNGHQLSVPQNIASDFIDHVR